MISKASSGRSSVSISFLYIKFINIIKKHLKSVKDVLKKYVSFLF